MPIAVTVKGVDLSVELLLWRQYGRRGQGAEILKATLALNPGLSRLGAVLPLGTPLLLADPPIAPARPVRVGVSIFDDDD